VPNPFGQTLAVKPFHSLCCNCRRDSPTRCDRLIAFIEDFPRHCTEVWMHCAGNPSQLNGRENSRPVAFSSQGTTEPRIWDGVAHSCSCNATGLWPAWVTVLAVVGATYSALWPADDAEATHTAPALGTYAEVWDGIDSPPHFRADIAFLQFGEDEDANSTATDETEVHC
jgi:hypothetical protein